MGYFEALRLVIVMLSNNVTSSLPALLELLFDVFKIPFLPMLFVREGSNILWECPNKFSKIITSLYDFQVSWSMICFHDLYL